MACEAAQAKLRHLRGGGRPELKALGAQCAAAAVAGSACVRAAPACALQLAALEQLLAAAVRGALDRCRPAPALALTAGAAVLWLELTCTDTKAVLFCQTAGFVS